MGSMALRAEGAVLLVLTALPVQPLAALSPIWASQGIRDTARAFARLQHDVVEERKDVVEFGSGEQGGKSKSSRQRNIDIVGRVRVTNGESL